jgi:methyltransferase (TIGR00027 family)
MNMEAAGEELEPVSKTARWTAAARALESDRPDRIFNDPYAHAAAGDDGVALLSRYQGAGVVPFIVIRTRYIDDAILARVGGDVSQVVLVGAGMDTRSVRLSWSAGVTLYELDRPALLAAKARLLGQGSSACLLRPAPADLTRTDWPDSLIAAGFNPGQPVVWVVEGVLFFLPAKAVGELLDTTRRLSAPGSVLIGDMTSEATLKNPLARSFLGQLADDGNPWLFGTNEPEELLSAHGWVLEDLKQPGEDGANFGRWPYPVSPRSVTTAPRSFLFTAATGQR